MKLQTKRLPNSKIELNFTINWEDFSRFYDQAILELGKDIEIKGFRKGKAPKEMLEKVLSLTDILNLSAQKAIEHYYKKAVLENKFEPISQPNVQILKIAPKNDFVFKVEVDVLPSINLPDYKKIVSNIKPEKIEVSDQEVDSVIFDIRKSRARFNKLNTLAKKGDFVEIEYEIKFLDEDANLRKYEKKYQDAFLLGQGKFISGFEENLIGMKENQEKEFKLRFPKEYNIKELSSKEALFKVRMKSVKEMILPELTDEFSRSLGDFKSVLDFKEKIRENIKMEKIKNEIETRKSKILKEIKKECNFEVPESLINLEKENLIRAYKKDVEERFKISFDEYLKKINISQEKFDDDVLKLAKERVENFLILREIGKEEGILVSDEEVEERLKYLNNQSYQNKDDIDINKIKGYYKNAIFIEKVFKRLLEFSDKK